MKKLLFTSILSFASASAQASDSEKMVQQHMYEAQSKVEESKKNQHETDEKYQDVKMHKEKSSNPYDNVKMGKPSGGNAVSE